MKRIPYLSLILLFVLVGCESNFSGNDETVIRSTPVSYTYNLQDKSLENLSLTARSKSMQSTVRNFNGLFSDIKQSFNRQPATPEELYIYDDELAMLEEKLSDFRMQYLDDPMLIFVDQYVALKTIDQFLTVPEGDTINEKRMEMIDHYTRELLRLQSLDVRVVGNALLLLQDRWTNEELLDGINYTLDLNDQQSVSKNSSHVPEGAPDFIIEARNKQAQVTEACVNELKSLRDDLTLR